MYRHTDPFRFHYYGGNNVTYTNKERLTNDIQGKINNSESDNIEYCKTPACLTFNENVYSPNSFMLYVGRKRTHRKDNDELTDFCSNDLTITVCDINISADNDITIHNSNVVNNCGNKTYYDCDKNSKTCVEVSNTTNYTSLNECENNSDCKTVTPSPVPSPTPPSPTPPSPTPPSPVPNLNKAIKIGLVVTGGILLVSIILLVIIKTYFYYKNKKIRLNKKYEV
jgi:hypothetical protein